MWEGVHSHTEAHRRPGKGHVTELSRPLVGISPTRALSECARHRANASVPVFMLFLFQAEKTSSRRVESFPAEAPVGTSSCSLTGATVAVPSAMGDERTARECLPHLLREAWEFPHIPKQEQEPFKKERKSHTPKYWDLSL